MPAPRTPTTASAILSALTAAEPEDPGRPNAADALFAIARAIDRLAAPRARPLLDPRAAQLTAGDLRAAADWLDSAGRGGGVGLYLRSLADAIETDPWAADAPVPW